MVTKAIERAQNTVEQRNAEIRKNVLKYDEVMNEQRKVIYKRRDQILDGADLRDEALEYLADAVDSTIDSLLRGRRSPRSGTSRASSPSCSGYWPDGAHRRAARGVPRHRRDLRRSSMAEATAYYERRENELGAELMREVERQVMLRIIDQRWREHLYEMDYLQEGINLRAMGQKDPLVEWQREGFEMFGADDARHRPGLRALRHARPGRAAGPADARRSCRTCRPTRPTTSTAGAATAMQRPRWPAGRRRRRHGGDPPGRGGAGGAAPCSPS